MSFYRANKFTCVCVICGAEFTGSLRDTKCYECRFPKKKKKREEEIVSKKE